MTKQITDRAKATVEYPDTLHIGTLPQTARFDAYLDQTGIALTLELPASIGQRKSVRMHFHCGLFADILRDLAKTAAVRPPEDLAYRDWLRDCAKALYIALETNPAKARRLLAGRHSISLDWRKIMQAENQDGTT